MKQFLLTLLAERIIAYFSGQQLSKPKFGDGTYEIIVESVICFFLFQSTSKGDTVELLKKQLQEKDNQILEGKFSNDDAQDNNRTT